MQQTDKLSEECGGFGIYDFDGSDVPSQDQLIAYERTVDEVRQIIGADTLGYLKLERLGELVDGRPVCEGCFTGQYPMEPPTEDIRGEYDQ